MQPRKTILAYVFMTAVVSLSSLISTRAAAETAHVIQPLKQAQWGPAPPMLPAGAQIAVLAGDPTKATPFTIRLKFPANYAIPAHSHPTDENVVIVSGALTFGMGDKLAKNATANKTLSAGGFALMPANMNHYAFTTGATTIVVYGQGPVDFKYVNPSDDPRNTTRAAK
ncbi:MAG TPA: cupin domain-containing protein [Thermoanaerobaculia bacterium]|nr:cupin domain-containing protein [Thermoanaerobaculia bacterium]